MKRTLSIIAACAALLLLFNVTRGEYKQQRISIDNRMKTLDPATQENLTYLDFLTYRVLGSQSARIATLGSSVTKGAGASSPEYSWRALLQDEIRGSSRELQHVTISNHGHSGYTSVRLLRSDIVQNVVNSDPDLIILESSIINNYRQNVPLELTKSSLEKLYRTFKTELPGVEILFLTPNPITKDNLTPSGLNELGLTYEDYVAHVLTVFEENEWNYYDVHAALSEEIEERGITTQDLLRDKIHPNDLGYQLWFTHLYEESLTQPNFGQNFEETTEALPTDTD